jgi:hypothetical protein
MLPERCVRRHVLRRAILRVRRCPALGRKLACCKNVVHSAKPFLIHLREQLRKPLLCLLPLPHRNLESQTCSSLDPGRDNHIDGDLVKQPPLDQLHPLDRLGGRDACYEDVGAYLIPSAFKTAAFPVRNPRPLSRSIPAQYWKRYPVLGVTLTT